MSCDNMLNFGGTQKNSKEHLTEIKSGDLYKMVSELPY